MHSYSSSSFRIAARQLSGLMMRDGALKQGGIGRQAAQTGRACSSMGGSAAAQVPAALSSFGFQSARSAPCAVQASCTLGFSAPSFASSACASHVGAQTRAMSTEVTDEGDDEASTIRRQQQPGKPPPEGEDGEEPHLAASSRGRAKTTASRDVIDEDEVSRLEASSRRLAPPEPSGPVLQSLESYRRQEREDPLELLLAAKEAFVGGAAAAGKQGAVSIPIPQATRELLYRYNWDKVLVDARRTTRVTPTEKKFSYTAMVAVGNGAGLFGLGTAQDANSQMCAAKAYLDAFSRLAYVPLYRGHTVHHYLQHRYHRLSVQVWPRPEGWGLRASDFMAELASLVGLRNATIQMRGTVKNKFFVATAFAEALAAQSVPHEGVEGRGVYVREVYHKPKLPEGLERGTDIM